MLQSYPLVPVNSPTYYVYLIICTVFVFMFTVMILTLLNKTTKRLNKESVSINTGNMYGSGKKDCNVDKTFCFTKEDCESQCVSTTVDCVHGTCIENINESSAINDCDPEKGVIGYLVGNQALGVYEYICKSVDPGIAISVSENRMCYGDSTYQINYLNSFPSQYSCTCTNQVVIPATSLKRQHVECDSRYTDLIPKIL